MRKHTVTFYSPGTFFPETTTKDIPSWDTVKAVELANGVTERYNAKPHSFRFTTLLTAKPVSDGEGGKLEVQPKEVESSGLYFLGGKLRTFDEVVAADDPKEEILRSNMENNGMWVIIQNDNSWRFTGDFGEKDCIVDDKGVIIRRGDDPELVEYRKKKTEERDAVPFDERLEKKRKAKKKHA